MTKLIFVGLAVIILSALVLALRFSVENEQFIVADLHVYFLSSRWVVEAGTLYRDFASEYPLFANLWFAIPRFLATIFGTSLREFAIVYVGLAGILYSAFFLYCGMTLRTVKNGVHTYSILIAMLSPVLIQLALLRFDFLPAIFVFFSLFFLRRQCFLSAALALGFAIAAKGYPLAYLPAFAIYTYFNSRTVTALLSIGLALMPFTGMFALAVMFAGYEGALSPFLFHAHREFDEYSLYHALKFVIGGVEIQTVADLITKFGVGILSLLGAILARTSFENFVRVLACLTFGLLFLSPITSPQFMIWAIPLVYFAASSRLALMFCIFALASNFWLVIEMGVHDHLLQVWTAINLALRVVLFIASAQLILAQAHVWQYAGRR